MKKYKWIFINLLLIVLVWVLVTFFTFESLESSTGHGETVSVPSLTSYSIAEVEDVLEKENLRYRVIDSSIYIHTMPKGAVIKQYPNAGASVKKNRQILITVNPYNEEKIPVPELKDVSIRQVIQELSRKGFRLGKLRMEDDLAENAVLWAEFQGDSLASGTMLNARSKIDLVIGNGLKSLRIALPDFIGRSYRDAMYTAGVNVLNPTALRFDETVVDTLSSFVYKQYPSTNMSRFIQKGDNIELWFTQDQNKLSGSPLE